MKQECIPVECVLITAVDATRCHYQGGWPDPQGADPPEADSRCSPLWGRPREGVCPNSTSLDADPTPHGQTPWIKNPPIGKPLCRQPPPPWRQSPCRQTPLPDRMTNRCFWKHYLPLRSVITMFHCQGSYSRWYTHQGARQKCNEYPTWQNHLLAKVHSGLLVSKQFY